ncbi:type II toxin-antitoxin system RelE/ParE family toxin [candidate division KSB1 bacterium]|nr:type II toxin-antitoxin system RelE/ParE family toxin [candidate division KSB1 bacterium]
MRDIKIYQIHLFEKQKKKLKQNQVKDLANAIKSLIENPRIGQQKTGDLSKIWVNKFSMVNQKSLLAYLWDAKSRTLIALGIHVNFYRDIKKTIKL